MRSRVLTTIAGLLFVLGPALAQKVDIEYDPSHPGEKIETYAWDASAGKTIKAVSELLHDHFVDTIDKYLEAGGFRKVESDPDVYVTYQTSVDETVKLNTEEFGYVVPTGWYAGPFGGSVSTYTGGTSTGTRVKSYEKGTLIVDVFDAKSKQLVWRGAASDIAVSTNPKKVEKRLDGAVAKIVDRWKQIKAGKVERD